MKQNFPEKQVTPVALQSDNGPKFLVPEEMLKVLYLPESNMVQVRGIAKDLTKYMYRWLSARET